MTDEEVVELIKEKRIKLPPSETRIIKKINDDYQICITNLDIVGCNEMWLVTYESHFLDDDIEIWNGFVINRDKEILQYDNGRDTRLSEGEEKA